MKEERRGRERELIEENILKRGEGEGGGGEKRGEGEGYGGERGEKKGEGRRGRRRGRGKRGELIMNEKNSE